MMESNSGSGADVADSRGQVEAMLLTAEQEFRPMKPSIRSHDSPPEVPSSTDEILESSLEEKPLVQEETIGTSQNYLDMMKTNVQAKPRPRKRTREEQEIINHYEKVIKGKDSEIKRLCQERSEMEGLRMKNKRLCQENDNLTKRVKFLTEQLNKEGLDHVSATVEATDDPISDVRRSFSNRS